MIAVKECCAKFNADSVISPTVLERFRVWQRGADLARVVGRLRHRLRPRRGQAEGRQAAAARRPDDRGVAQSLQKVGVSTPRELSL